MTLILAEYLKTNGITAKALSSKLEVKGYKLSSVSISNILTGKHSPKVETLENIADALGTSIVDFFEGGPKEMETIYKKNEDGTYSEIGYIKK